MLFKKFRRKKNEQPQQPEMPKMSSMELPTADQQVIDDCEQMIEASKELEETRAEYRLVTSYLTDIQVIEDLRREERDEITETASNILQLDQTRREFLKIEKKITDTQFAQMQDEENEIPASIHRLKSNETYLDTVKKDLNYLEGEKTEWTCIKDDCKREIRTLQKISYALLLCFGLAVLTLLAAGLLMKMDTKLPMLIAGFLAALLAVAVLWKYQECQRNIRKAEATINHAITLENHVKIKYVNIKNAVDYACEKYHVKNSYELTYIWERYLEAVRQQKQLQQTNDDLEYYRKKLVQQMENLYLHDPAIWVSYAPALVDKKEMVEVKHNLLVRRQKLRTRVEYNTFLLQHLQQKIRDNLPYLHRDTTAIEQIIKKINEINGLE